MIKKILFSIISLILLLSVSAGPAGTENLETKKGAPSETIKWLGTPNTTYNPATPEFRPVKENTSPLKDVTVSVSARNTPLRDVLYTVADAANLNLVIERSVDPELPVTMTFRDLSIENALDTIFDSVDYFYSIKDNILVAKAMGTKIFEISQPSIVQEYKIDVGGDILSGTSSGEGGESSVSGDVSIKSSSDEASFKFWESLEKSLATLLPPATEEAAAEETNSGEFVVNRMAGTIMVTATKNDLKRVSRYIARIKKVFNRQVLIEARIVEVQLSSGLKYGIDWTAVGEWFGVGKTTFSTELFNSVVGSGSPAFVASITENDNLALVLRALQEQGDVNILSNPRVSIMNGQTSMLSVGRNTTFISRVESTTDTDGGSSVTTFTVDTNSVLSGIMFGLVPYINNNNEITLTITPIVTNLVELEEKTIGTAGNAVEIKLPTVDLREMSTTVKLLDGQLVIIGGLIDTKEQLKEDKVPVLGDLPVVGKAFQRIDKSNESTELVIMLTPKIIS